MEMGNILSESFKYPVSNWKRLLIFGLIFLIYQFCIIGVSRFSRISVLLLILIIPGIIAYFIIMGYRLRAMETSIKGENEAPTFNKWSQMLLDGLKVFVVAIIYGFIPAMIIGLGFFMVIVGSSLMKISGALVLIVGGILLFGVTLIMVIGLSNMAYQGKIDAALEFAEITSKIKKIGWLNLIVIMIILGVINILLAAAAVLLSVIPILGIFLASIIVCPYMDLFIARAYALIYKETIDEPGESLMEGVGISDESLPV
ncbi:MAG: DUF4013 domain-containing protein [Methanobacteriaceae archaeon]|nr:DUF4013 domain-containing protein [Methanobacteriaceae archaeon]